MTMTKGQMATWVAEHMGRTKKESNQFLNDLGDLVVEELVNTGEFKFHDLVVLKLKDQPERQGRNPATGQAITIAAKTVVKARILKPLKDAVL